MSVAFADPSTLAVEDYGGYEREVVTVNFTSEQCLKTNLSLHFTVVKTKAQRGRKLAVVVQLI